MTKNNTPPESPGESNEYDMENIPFNEQDMVEVIEGDLPEDSEELDEDEDGDETISEEKEIVLTRDDAKFIFQKHTDGVLCSAFHPKKTNIVATGGIDDTVYVWDINCGDVLMKSETHEDSVEMIAFSYDGKYLAASDLSGKLKVWNTSDYTLAREFELDDEFSWSLWHHGSNILISSSQKGLIYMYKVLTGEMKMVMAPFGPMCICGKVFPDGKRLACGYTEGNLKIVDLKQGVALSSIKLNDGLSGVSCLDVHKDNNLLICGCDNGDIFLVNSQAGKLAAVLNSSRISNMCKYIETIAFCKDMTYNVAASGSLDGNLVIWDITKQTLRYQTCFPSSVNLLVWHPNQPILYTSHANGLVHMYDSKAGNVLRELMGHGKCIYSISLSPDATTLMTSSEDKTVRIYRPDEEEPN